MKRKASECVIEKEREISVKLQIITPAKKFHDLVTFHLPLPRLNTHSPRRRCRLEKQQNGRIKNELRERKIKEEKSLSVHAHVDQV